MIFLLTDALFWLLIAMGAFYLVRPKPRHVQAAWKQICQSKMGMSTLVILSFYLLITMLDCIHFKTAGSGSVISVLDYILAPINHSLETTYSPPFGTKNLNYPDASSDLLETLGIDLFSSLMISIPLTVVFGYLVRRAEQNTILSLAFFGCVFVLLSLYLLSRHYHIMGTDKVGQDVFYQTIKSIRTGFLIGTLTTLIILPFALFFGTLAGYFRGWVDDLVQYVYTTLSSIPDILLIVAFMLMLELIMSRYPILFDNLAMRADLRLLAICVIFGLTSWTGFCRLIRAETLKIREQDYVHAGRVLGSSDASIIRRHIVPNLMHIVLITVAMDFSALVLAEAVLSYIGVGVDSSTNSWGNMINAARFELARDPMVWWSLTAAFSFMFVLVLCANLFADVLQASFNPRSWEDHQ